MNKTGLFLASKVFGPHAVSVYINGELSKISLTRYSNSSSVINEMVLSILNYEYIWDVTFCRVKLAFRMKK